MIGFFKDFHKKGNLSLNTTFLVLNPKKKEQKILEILGLSVWWVNLKSCWPIN